MTLIAALTGALLTGGVLLLIAGLRRAPVMPKNLDAVGRPRLARLPHRTLLLAGIATVAGLVVGLLTGWVIAVPLFPAAVIGLPWLLGNPGEARLIERLEGLAEWTRNLAGVIRVGASLERALVDTLRTTPASVHDEVATLIRRLRGKWDTEEALRQFAADFDDVTGDLVAATLILASRTRADGLAAILSGLAESVSAEVASRRQLEADRAKPRQTARLLTLITVGCLTVLAVSGQYLEPYHSPLGQLALAGFLALYVALLIVMKKMAAVVPLPRFLSDARGAR